MLRPMITSLMCCWVLGERLRPCSTAVNEFLTPLRVHPEYSGPVVTEDSWTFERLIHLVSGQVPESLTLEFKASTALEKTETKRKELSKDVSAMANSAGGVIVYGVREDPKTHVAASLDEGVEVAEIAPDWIEQVADSNIQPKIDGLIVHMVHPGSNTAKAFYIVEVPQGHTAHMAADNRYHKRRGATVTAMDDYEVRDAMGRDIVPRLRVEIEARSVPDIPSTVDLTLFVVNDAVTPVEWCVVQLIFPATFEVLKQGGAAGCGQATSDTGVPVKYLRFHHGGVNAIPIWQGLRMNIHPPNTGPVQIKAPSGLYYIFWRITAPGMGWRADNSWVNIP